MQDLDSMVSALRRPALLVRAARHGLDDYARHRHLPRLLAGDTPNRPGPALIRLLEAEAAMEARRTAKTADYSIARHIELLIALMGEARLLRMSQPGG